MVVSCSDRYLKHFEIYFCCGLLLQFFRDTFVLSLSLPSLLLSGRGQPPYSLEEQGGLVTLVPLYSEEWDLQVTRGVYATLVSCVLLLTWPWFFYYLVTFVFKEISFFPVLPSHFSCLQ